MNERWEYRVIDITPQIAGRPGENSANTNTPCALRRRNRSTSRQRSGRMRYPPPPSSGCRSCSASARAKRTTKPRGRVVAKRRSIETLFRVPIKLPITEVENPYARLRPGQAQKRLSIRGENNARTLLVTFCRIVE